MKKHHIHLNNLLLLLMATFFVACGPQQKEERSEIRVQQNASSKILKFAVNEKIGQLVGDQLELTANKALLQRVMESNYQDDTKIDNIYLAVEEGQYFLYGTGFNKKNESRNIRYRLRVGTDGGLKTINGGTDTCDGVNCDKCKFTSGIGCDCTQTGSGTGSSYCNHSTSGGAAVHLMDAVFSDASIDDDGQILGEVSAGEVDPELLDQLFNGEALTLDNDYIVPAEIIEQIYGNSGLPPAFEGDLTVPAGQYPVDVDAAQGVVVIVIVTDNGTVVVIVVN